MTEAGSTKVALVLRHNGLGDVVTARPALQALRRHYHKKGKNWRVLTTCPERLTPLAQHLELADAYVSQKFADRPARQDDPVNHQQIDIDMLTGLVEAGLAVDHLICMRTPGSELRPVFDRLSPDRVLAFRHPDLIETLDCPELDFDWHIQDRWQKLLWQINVVLDPQDICFQIDHSPNAKTLIHCGSGSPSRIWPAQRWTEVVQTLAARGHDIVMTGTQSEYDRAQGILRSAGLNEERNSCGRLDIMALTRLVAGARLVLCVDTGLAHLATGLRRNAVTLFGPTAPSQWGPRPQHPNHVVLWAGRQGEAYGETADAGLLEIMPEEVIAAAKELGE